MTLRSFIKYHGLGNDFLIFPTSLDDKTPIDPVWAAQVCQRGTGVGADGIAIARSSETGDVMMDLINSDGSLPEMCGNGLRCFVMYAVKELGMTANPLAVETRGGIRMCHWRQPEGPDDVFSVRVDMGPAHWDRPRIPMSDEGSTLHVSVEADGRSFEAHGVNTGNPHMVILGDADRSLTTRYGSHLTHHPVWLEGANVEFARVISPQEIEASVWERGCGPTEACGTGATATACVAVKLGHAPFETPITVHLPGGDLIITVEQDFVRAWMEGPAVETYRGSLSQ